MCPRRPSRASRWKGPGDARNEHGRDACDDGHHGEHAPRPADGQQQAGQGWCSEDADALDPAGDDVRRRQLLRCARERGHEHGLRRAGGRHRDSRERGECVRRECRAVCQQHYRRGSHCEGLRRIGAGQHPRRPAAVGERCRERREEHRRDELRERDEPGCGRAAAAIGVDQHGDPDAPFGGVEAEEGQLDAAQLRVAQDAADDPRNLARVAHRARRSRSCALSLSSRSSRGAATRSCASASGSTTRSRTSSRASTVALRPRAKPAPPRVPPPRRRTHRHAASRQSHRRVSRRRFHARRRRNRDSPPSARPPSPRR